MNNKLVKQNLLLALDEIYKEDLETLLKDKTNDFFSKKEKLDILAWAERNLIVSIPLFEKYQPQYVYKEGNKKFLAGFTIINDLNLNNYE
jgi:hypothetical protein